MVETPKVIGELLNCLQKMSVPESSARNQPSAAMAAVAAGLGSERPLRDGVIVLEKRNQAEEPYRTYLHDTHSIAKKCWPSYNTPYEKTPRALIFRRDHDDVTDMNSMIRLMSNNYTEDPLSRCECDPPYSGENATSCRSDLNPPKITSHGHEGEFKLINHQWESSLYTNNQQFGPNFAQP
ncbi:hypothetical protein NECAME_00870 [Necator americanus]|uniref:Phospholipase B-like n=1 Tax=Necator americanus TaxID=51031 RepID=W2SQN1_NECAM|nr:hypothetical protein NECAME_00870 [Necator americanus]ETN71181.1 hypothetical protein NECAME_00870 [Necator americanus]